MHEPAASMHGKGWAPLCNNNAETAPKLGQLNVTQWNVHGLQPEKFAYDTPHVLSMVDSADVLVFTESWIDDEDAIPDYITKRFTCYAADCERTMRSGRGIGGVLVCVKPELQATMYKRNTQAGIVWVKLPRCAGDKDLYIAACYFQPEESTVWRRRDIDPFEVLESDIIEISHLGEVMIVGDLNARTGLECEQGVMEAGTRQHAIDAELEAVNGLLRDHNTSCRAPDRMSQDSITNKWGKKLLSLCGAAGLSILNGRVPGDMLGKYTYSSKANENANSLVDYCICNTGMIFDINGVHGSTRMEVDQHADFRVWSDHWPVRCTVEIRIGTQETDATDTADGIGDEKKGRRRRRRRKGAKLGYKWCWDNSRLEQYTHSMNEQLASLDMITADGTVSCESMIDALKAVVCKAAARSGMPSRKQVAQKNDGKTGYACAAAVAPWYNSECMVAYARMRATRAHMLARWEVGEGVLPEPRGGSKEEQEMMRHFKLAIRRAKRRHLRARQARLADMLAHKPQAFWRLTKKKTKQADGLSKQAWHDYFKSLRSPQPPTAGRNEVRKQNTVIAAAAPHAVELDVPFSENEIACAIERMHTGKCADKYGDIIELFINPKVDGRPLLLPYLTRIMNTMFASGSYPTAESLGMIVTMYKGKGDVSEGKHYRGITIITVLSKMYATALNMRLVTWRGQGQGRQARGQAGFTADHRTVDHAFVLQHAIHKYCRKPGKRDAKTHGLYTCFIDLSKAFDTVDRPKLWDRLAELGIQGTMLKAIQSYYQNVDESVRTSEGFTEQIRSEMGVRQGCPLSPTLFGFFIDKVEAFIGKLHPHSTVHIGGIKVPMLLYADDIVIMATSEWELQYMVALFSGFCSLHGLAVNTDKTQVMVFSQGRKQSQAPARIIYNGRYLEQVEQYKYLGIVFHWRLGAVKGGELLLESARIALLAMQKQARAQQMTDPNTLCRMFDTLVLPIMLYGCEIWGTCQTLVDTANRLHASFLRRLLSLPMRTDTWALLIELGRTPISHRISERLTVYRSRLQGMAAVAEHRLLGAAAKENFAWCAQGDFRDVKCWSAVTHRCLMKACGGQPVSCLQMVKRWLACEGGVMMNQSMIAGFMDRREFYGTHAYRHAAGERRRSYARWFWAGAAKSQDLTNMNLRKSLMRFRLGAHHLCAIDGAWSEGYRIPREQRVCKCCSMRSVEDEAHLIFECPHYDMIRLGFAADIFMLDAEVGVAGAGSYLLSEMDVKMRKFFGQEKQAQVAKFIQCCLRERKTKLKQLSVA